MKKLLLFLPAIILFAACSKHNDAKPAPTLTPQTATAADIVGDWQVAIDSSFQVQNGATTISTQNGGSGIHLIFKPNGVGETTDASGNVEDATTYTVVNGVIKDVLTNSNSESIEIDFTILAITSNRMVLRQSLDGGDYVDASLNKL